MSPERVALLAELAGEILHHYARGRHLVGVDGTDPGAVARFADGLAAALRQAGADADRARASVEGLRAELLEPFRAGEGDALLVVDGPLLGTAAADALAWTLWIDADADGTALGGPGTRTAADAIVDVTDPEHPVRRFSDWCVVPRR